MSLKFRVRRAVVALGPLVVSGLAAAGGNPAPVLLIPDSFR
jgi:hypothetical protein